MADVTCDGKADTVVVGYQDKQCGSAYSKLGGGGLYSRLKADLDSLNKGKANNTQDALIAEVAIANGYTLLTADYQLAAVAKKHGCTVRHFAP